MSGYSVEIIPVDAWYVPTARQASAAETLFEGIVAPLVHSSWVGPLFEVATTNKPQFVSCLGNFDGVDCPRCGAALDLDWWSERMDADYDGEGFRLAPFDLPCCRVRANLDELRYDRSQGFARYVISCRDPPFGELTDEQLASIGAALGCRVRQICTRI